MIQRALRAFVLANTAVAAVIGNRFLRASQIPQGELRPRIGFSRISGLMYGALDTGPINYRRERYQLDCWGDYRPGQNPGETAEALAELLAKPVDDGGFLNGFKGQWTYTDPDEGELTYDISACVLEDRRDLSEVAEDGGEKAQAAVSLDFIITYRKAA